jgi:hypothetical protein
MNKPRVTARSFRNESDKLRETKGLMLQFPSLSGKNVVNQLFHRGRFFRV